MFPLRGRGEPRLDDTQEIPPPCEGCTAHDTIRAAMLAEIDRKLLALALIPAPYRAPGTRARMDQLLDERLTVRPGRPATVPVIPGRSS